MFRARRPNDSAVSPVIAVILMVAITVVLAATVYVWVSGFSAQGTNPAKTMSLSSAGSLVTGATLDGDDGDSYKMYTVSSASSGTRYSDLSFTLNGATATRSAGGCDATISNIASGANAANFIACSGPFSASSSERAADAIVTAGDHVYITLEGASMAGNTLRILDTQANSVILTLTVG